MKSIMFAAALLAGTAAYAQTTTTTATTAGGTPVAPSNAAPERDARGIPVISAEAVALRIMAAARTSGGVVNQTPTRTTVRAPIRANQVNEIVGSQAGCGI